MASAKWCCAVLMACTAGWAPAQTDKASLGAADPVRRLAEARADAKLAASLVKAGQKVASFCANCHGEGGNSRRTWNSRSKAAALAAARALTR